MKKYIYILILAIVIGIGYLIVDELTFSPLKNREFKVLFKDYDGNFKKTCNIDALGWSPEGAIFDFYIYKNDKLSIDSGYPNFSQGWRNIELTDDVILSHWKKTPIDSVSLIRYEFVLSADEINKSKCGQLLNAKLNESQNYYSYIYINELEHYFFLACPDEGNLYYIRKKGF